MPRIKLLLFSLLLSLPIFLLTPGKVFAATAPGSCSCSTDVINNCNPGFVPNPQGTDPSGFAACFSCSCIATSQVAPTATPAPAGSCPGTCVDTASCISPISGFAGACGTGRSCCQSALLGTGNPTKTTDVTCDGGKGINTALGCLSFDLAQGGLVRSLLTLATGVGGAISLMLMLYGFFILSTSAGIPDKIKEGQEIITGAVGGLIFILFATIMMNLIGIKILGLPGLQ